MPVQGWEIPNALGSQGFAWPTGRPPGFSAQHVAGNACRFSAVAYQGNFFQVGGSAGILSGKGTFVSTLPTFNMDGFLGPCNNTAGGSSYVQFTGVNRPFDQQITIAVIMRILATPSAATALQVGATGGTGCAGMRFPGSTSMYLDTFGAGDFPTWTAGATYIGTQNPIFVIMSGQAAGVGVGLANYMSMRLDTGAYRTASFSGGAYALSAPTTWNYRIGNNPNAGGGLVAAIAAVMVSGQFMTVPQMLAWAEDPWSFWYPQSPTALILQNLQAPQGAASPFNVSPGDTKGDLSPRQVPFRPDETWAFNFNPTQMNSGQEPIGAADYERPMHTRGQDRGYGPDRTWSFNYNPSQMNTGAKPISPSPGDTREDLSSRQVPFRPEETWISFFNPSQMNSGPVPAGVSEYTLSPRQVPFRPDATWVFNYNPTQMNTGQAPVGLQIWELSPRQVPFRPDVTWNYFFNPAQMNTGAFPAGFNYYDLTGRPVRQDANWLQTPLTFNATVTFPPGLQVYDLPARPYRLDETWISFYNPTQMQTGTEPFFQTEWPLPTPRFRPDVTWSFNYNPTQMNTGQLPVGFQSWDLSPRQIPFRPDVTWVYSFNPAQLNTGQFPAGLQYYDLTGRPLRPDANWLQNPLTFTTTIVYPAGMQVYDLTGRPYRLDETWVSFFNPTQMNTGAVPIGAQRLELWTPPFRPLFNWEAQAATFTVVVTNPFSQTDWPLPTLPARLSVTWDFPTPGYYPGIILMGQIWM